jgi:hypothetical protein
VDLDRWQRVRSDPLIGRAISGSFGRRLVQIRPGDSDQRVFWCSASTPRNS